MKKTLLALAVLAAAGSANAIEVYNQDGVTVDFKGDFEFRYVKDIAKDDNLKLNVSDADLGFDTRYAVNDQFSIGGYVSYEADNGNVINGSDDGDKTGVKGGNAYVGFYTADFGSLKFGKLDIQLDDMGIGSDELFGMDTYFSDLEAGGNEAVRYDLDKGMYYIGLGYIQNAHGTNGDISRDHNWDVRGGVRVADFDFTAYYGESANATDASTDTNQLYAFEVRFAGIENVNLELGYYGDSYADQTDADKSDADTFALAADYTMNSWKFAAGYATTDYDKAGFEDLNQWFANVGYKLAPNTNVYVEIGDNDAEDSELGYGIGIEASF